MKISVCMATYNGEKYIKEQLESILCQLGENDELIVSDDSSTDKTVEIIKLYKDNRIRIFENQKFRSPIHNFENALKYVTGDIIVLSDQDDVWDINKLFYIKQDFENIRNTPNLKMYNGRCIDNNGKVIKEDLFEYLKINKGLMSNIKRNSFIGCNIVFNKELLKITLPFPKDIPMHDMWIGTCAYLFGNVEFVEKKVFNYRLHDNNYTGKRTSFFQKIIWRFNLIKNLIKRYIYVKFSS